MLLPLNEYGFVGEGNGAGDAGVDACTEFAFGRRGDEIANTDAGAVADRGHCGDAGVLLERQDDTRWGEDVVDERARIVEVAEAEPGDELLHGDAAEVGHGMRGDRFGRAGEEEAALAGGGLGLHADGFGVEVFGAGVHAAEIALAAIEGACDHLVGRGGEAERAHGGVRLNGMAEKIARAELRAEAALVAGGAADAGDLRPLCGMAADDGVIRGKDDDAAGGLGDGLVDAGGGASHHDAAEEDAEVADGGSAGCGDDLAEGDADGDADGDGVADGSGDGEVLVGNGLVEADVEHGLDVGDEGADVLGEAAGWDDATGDHVDEDELVAGGVDVRERRDADAGGYLGFEGGDDVVVLLLDADNALLRADDLHHGLHAAEEWGGVVVEEFLVFMEEGLTLGSVGDDEGDGRRELGCGGKAAAAGSDDAEFGDASGSHPG